MAKSKKTLIKGKILDRLKKLDKKALFVILFDVLFYITLAAFAFSAVMLVSNNMNKVTQVAPLMERIVSEMSQGAGTQELSNQMDIGEIRGASALLKSLIRTTAIIAGTAIALIIVSSLFFRSLIWSKVLKLKFNKKYFKKYFLLNLSWIAAWAVIFFLLSKVFKREMFLWVLGIGLLIYLYFSVILRSLFDEKKKSIDMVKKSFSIGTKKIHLVIYKMIPAIVGAALLAVLFRYLWFKFGMCTFFVVSVGVLPIIYFAWVRILMAGIVKNIQVKG